jgi:hypothetical protein
MEIRTRSKTGPLVPSLADITVRLGQQVDAMKQQWLDQLAKDPASFARLEVEIHDHFRCLADQMTASLLAEATTTGDRAEPDKKGGPAALTGRWQETMERVQAAMARDRRRDWQWEAPTSWRS